MKIAIFGLGYVGFTAACCMASEGHTVIGVDVSDAKLNDIRGGIAPFHEPNLQDMMNTAQQKNLLSATNSVSEALVGTELAIVCVGTPSGANGAHDMRYIEAVTRQIAEALLNMPSLRLTISYRSTMRPGTMLGLISPIFFGVLGDEWQQRIELIYNPEFLRETTAIEDYFNPPKIVIGTRDGDPSRVMDMLHANMSAPVFYTGFDEAELTKFVDNSWHAVKVSFANEVGRLCEKLGISASKVHEIFVSDTKLNISSYYMRPGGAFGGSCLPKDVRALTFIGTEVNAKTHLLDSLLRSNEAHKDHQFEAMQKLLPNTGGKVLMVGLAFKAGTDDLRESPNVDLARKLLAAGHELSVYDPNLEPVRLRGQNLQYVYAELPSIDEVLIEKAEAESRNWDLVVVNNATGSVLDFYAKKTYTTYSIA